MLCFFFLLLLHFLLCFWYFWSVGYPALSWLSGSKWPWKSSTSDLWEPLALLYVQWTEVYQAKEAAYLLSCNSSHSYNSRKWSRCSSNGISSHDNPSRKPICKASPTSTIPISHSFIPCPSHVHVVHAHDFLEFLLNPPLKYPINPFLPLPISLMTSMSFIFITLIHLCLPYPPN